MRLIPVVAAAGVAFALTAQPASAARVYAGQPSGDSPFQFVIALSNTGKKVSQFTFHFDVSCGTDFRSVDFGSTTSVDDEPEFFQLGRHYLICAKIRGNTLSGTFMGLDRVDETTIETMYATITGSFKAKSAKGKVAVEFIQWDAETGRTVAQCAKNLPWRALRDPGVVYGGRTSQDEPVVLELTGNRKRISHAHLGWLAECSDGTWWTEAHDEFDLRPFALSRSGAFSKVFSFSFGTGVEEVERFVGKVSRTRASGTFQGDVTIPTDAGNITCATGRVSWKAATG